MMSVFSADEINKEHKEWRAEHKAALEALLGEPYVAEPLLEEASAGGSGTCSAGERDSWMGEHTRSPHHTA